MELIPEALQHAAAEWHDRGGALLAAGDRLVDAPTDGFTAAVAPLAASTRATWCATSHHLADRTAGCAAALELTLQAAVGADDTVAAWWRRLAGRIDDP